MKHWNAKQKDKTIPGEPPPVHDRAVCPQCGKTLLVQITRETDNVKSTTYDDMLANIRGRNASPVVSWSYKSYGHFCTMRCATRWANKAVDEITHIVK